MAWLDMFKFPQSLIFWTLSLFWSLSKGGQGMRRGRGMTLILTKGSVTFAVQVWMNIAFIRPEKSLKLFFAWPPFLFPLLGFKPSWSDELSSHEHHTFRSPRKAQEACLWFSSHATTLYFLSGSDKRLTTSIILSYSSVYAEYVQK